MKLGLITYDYAHLKTEQLVWRYLENKLIEEIKLFALPFSPRKERNVIFEHRPNQFLATQTENLSRLDKVSFQKWDGKEILEDQCDLFIIGGAGILDVSFAKGKPIVNAHPGIIPLSRGLDSFKWAILKNDPVGNTIHLIDSEVDKGELICIKETPIFPDDNIQTLARRHYDLEIDMLSNILDFLHLK
ncbi:MAG: hypothetical protein CMO46_09130, partial [Verrucomicrobiales bacterium]|nr:hypothetical protein [Verrucomicrobiales bacterium]